MHGYPQMTEAAADNSRCCCCCCCCDRGSSGCVAHLHPLAHRGIHPKLHTRRRKALSGLTHVVTRYGAPCPGAPSRHSSLRDVRAVEKDLSPTLRRAAFPTQALLADKRQGVLAECFLVERAACWREAVLVASAMIGLDSPSHFIG